MTTLAKKTTSKYTPEMEAVLQVEYNKQERVTKTGEPIATKEALVTEIENAMQVSGLKSLAKAEKKALQVLLRAVQFETAKAS